MANSFPVPFEGKIETCREVEDWENHKGGILSTQEWIDLDSRFEKWPHIGQEMLIDGVPNLVYATIEAAAYDEFRPLPFTANVRTGKVRLGSARPFPLE